MVWGSKKGLVAVNEKLVDSSIGATERAAPFLSWKLMERDSISWNFFEVFGIPDEPADIVLSGGCTRR